MPDVDEEYGPQPPPPSVATQMKTEDCDALEAIPVKRQKLSPFLTLDLSNDDTLEVYQTHVHQEQAFLGRYVFADGSEYVGEFRDGCPSGQGLLLLASGDEYEGEFLRGKFHGFGCYRYATGEVYTGQWVEDQKHGTGLLEFVQGDFYEGQFIRDDMHGQGIRKFISGDEYRGGFANGMKSGEGLYRSGQGGSYEGAYAHDMRNGIGETVFPNGDVHKGEYQHDRMHGMGTYFFADGSVFKGQFIHGVQSNFGYYSSPSGNAVYVYENGNVYRGDMREDSSRSSLFVRQGKGTTVYADGTVMDGSWDDDRPHGLCSMRFNNGDVFEGEYSHGKRKGKGSLFISSKKTRLEGLWEDNRMVLESFIVRYANGDIWEGPLRKVKGEYLRHGRGSLKITSDGSVIIANWQDDIMVDTNDGRIKLSNGSSFKGRLSASGEFIGNVVIYYADRGLYKGEVKNLKRHGQGKMTFSDGDSYCGGDTI